MQSDAFPTPPIYVHEFQPRLVQLEPEPQQDGVSNLVDAIELLMTDCSFEESRSFWLATDRLKIKHQVIESMQKIESLFLDLARASTQDQEIVSAVSENLRYAKKAQFNPPSRLDIPNLLKQRVC
jgi:hypothetical protein